MTALIFMTVMYFVILTLFACYAFMQMKEAKKIMYWCEKSDVELKAIRDRNLELEKRVKELEKVEKFFSDTLSKTITAEPDFVPRQKEVKG